MNNLFKTSAITLLVSFGITACGSSSGGSGETNATTPQSTITLPTVQPTEQAQGSSNSGNSATVQSQSSANSASEQNSNSAINTPSSQPTPREELPKTDNSWRKQYISLGSIATADLLKDNTTVRNVDVYLSGSTNANQIIDYDQLSNGQQGYFEGSYKPEAQLTNTNSVRYAFINQPYSTYGMIANDLEPTVATVTHVGRDSTSPTMLTGQATYKGEVIGTLKDWQDNSTPMPKKDGTAEITVNFNQNSATMSGVLNTHSVGKIELPEIHSLPKEGNGVFAFSTSASSQTLNSVTKVEKFANAQGDYHAYALGNNANDVVGGITVNDLDNAKLYQAAFGGTKQ